jgi:hypothetical protein
MNDCIIVALYLDVKCKAPEITGIHQVSDQNYCTGTIPKEQGIRDTIAPTTSLALITITAGGYWVDWQ